MRSSAPFLRLIALLVVAITMGCTSAGPSTSDKGQQAASTRSSDEPATGDEVVATAAKPTKNEVVTAADESAPATPAAEEQDAAADVPPAEPTETAATADAAAQPVPRQAAKPVVESYAEGVPPVLLSAGHAALCKVMVGDAFPKIELPTLDGSAAQQLSSLVGSRATVVVFWSGDRWMSESALRDLAAMESSEGVAVVGIATQVAQDAAGNLLSKTGAKFPQLFDADGQALSQVGQDALPRVYVLDGEGRIAWFDIEYSEATRRELAQTLAALTK